MYELIWYFHARAAAQAAAQADGATAARPLGPDAWPPVGVRVRAALRRRSLDAVLAAGADPGSSDLLAVRAEQLASRRVREQTADALCELVVLSEHAARRRRTVAGVYRESVRGAQDALLGLARSLRTAPCVSPRGVAQARLLLGAGTGPRYARGEAGAVREAAEAAVAALA